MGEQASEVIATDGGQCVRMIECKRVPPVFVSTSDWCRCQPLDMAFGMPAGT